MVQFALLSLILRFAGDKKCNLLIHPYYGNRLIIVYLFLLRLAL